MRDEPKMMEDNSIRDNRIRISNLGLTINSVKENKLEIEIPLIVVERVF